MITIERLCLISCCGPKRDHAAPARDLYTSDLFCKSVRWAGAQRLPWAVLSAQHGLVWPDDVLEPYDLQLGRLTAAERQGWAVEVAESVGEASPAAVAVVLAGAAYADPLAPLLEARGWSVEQPLRGKQIGERKRWLKGGVQTLAVSSAQTEVSTRRTS